MLLMLPLRDFSRLRQPAKPLAAAPIAFLSKDDEEAERL
jgi:hypothetical protein